MTKKTLYDEGFAFWLETRDRINCSLDVHINEWFSPKEQTFMDIGLRVYSANSIDKIGIFIPFLINEEEITDLFDQMSDKNISRIIFNSDCKINSSTAESITEIKYNDREENLVELSLLSFSTQEVYDDNNIKGTIIYLDIKNAKEKFTKNELYIRFRIPHKPIKDLFKSKINLTSCLISPENSFEYNYVIRVNEVRTLNKNIRMLLKSNCSRINKIIVTASIPTKFDICDDRCYRIRTLEKTLYETYLPNNFSGNDTLSYQWKCEYKDHYYINIKIKKKSISVISVLGYLIVTILLSTFCSALWTLITGVL